MNMDSTFNFLSQFAQSWAMAGMAVFFLAAILWAFRPGNRRIYDEAANSIFRDDTKPVSQPASQSVGREPGRATSAQPGTRSTVKGA
jgi:cytochrome c oxidase cbb3-type subunit 4